MLKILTVLVFSTISFQAFSSSIEEDNVGESKNVFRVRVSTSMRFQDARLVEIGGDFEEFKSNIRNIFGNSLEQNCRVIFRAQDFRVVFRGQGFDKMVTFENYEWALNTYMHRINDMFYLIPNFSSDYSPYAV